MCPWNCSQYHTPAWIEDLDEVRRALGHDRINLVAGSFGTHAAQRYIRRYGAHVRAAYLLSPVPMANRTPLYMPRDGQAALERLFGQCAADAQCRAAFPRFRENFAAVLVWVKAGPVATFARHPETGARQAVRLDEAAFVDAVRVFLYRSAEARQLPFLIEQAVAGDYSAFADAAVRSARGFYGAVRSGVALAVTCSEYVNRIRPEEVAPAARGSFLGAWRINAQMAACAEWPRTDLPEDYDAPFRSDVPVLMVTGDSDPVAPPSWAEGMKAYLPEAVHLVVPGVGHTEKNACVLAIRAAFFRAGTGRGLDTGCVSGVRPTAFRLPGPRTGRRSLG